MWPFTGKKHKEPNKIIHASHYKELQEKTNHWIHKQKRKAARKGKILIIDAMTFAPVSDTSLFMHIKYRKEYDEEHREAH